MPTFACQDFAKEMQKFAGDQTGVRVLETWLTSVRYLWELDHVHQKSAFIDPQPGAQGLSGYLDTHLSRIYIRT